jgi:hypothetical protein
VTAASIVKFDASVRRNISEKQRSWAVIHHQRAVHRVPVPSELAGQLLSSPPSGWGLARDGFAPATPSPPGHGYRIRFQ